MVEDTLRELGLNDKEIKIYLSLLPLGSAPASILGKRTKITRSTAQYCCQQLVKKGLISVIEKNNSFIYTPESPDKIIYLLDQQKKEIEEKEVQVNRIIGNLKNMMSTSAVLPKVKFFEGREGFIKVYETMAKDITKNGEILSYTNPVPEESDNFNIKEIMWGFINERKKKKVAARLIGPFNELTQKLRLDDNKDLRKTRFVYQENLNLGNGENFIYNDRLCHVTVTKNFLFGYIVQDKIAAEINKALFEVAWRRSIIEDEEIIGNNPEFKKLLAIRS